MIDREPSHIDTREAVSTSDIVIRHRSNVILKDICTDGTLQNMGDLLSAPLFHKLISDPFNVWELEYEDYTEVLFCLHGALNAREVNTLMYMASPHQGYGLDTEDILNDWRALYEDDHHRNRLERHRQIPGWGDFEKSKERILKVLEIDYDRANRTFLNKPDNSLTPIIRIMMGEEPQLVTTLPSQELWYKIRENTPTNALQDREVSDPLLGITMIAALSEDATLRWNPWDGYRAGATKTQTIGPTQVIPYALWHLNEINSSKLVKELVESIDQ